MEIGQSHAAESRANETRLWEWPEKEILRQRIVEIISHESKDSVDAMLSLVFGDGVEIDPAPRLVRHKIEGRFAVARQDYRLAGLGEPAKLI